MGLEFAHGCADGWSVLKVSGEIDVATAPDLARRLRCLAEIEPGKVLVDLGDVTFCDASGLRALVSAHHVLAGRDERLHLSGLRPSLARVLDITGLDEVFTVADVLTVRQWWAETTGGADDMSSLQAARNLDAAQQPAAVSV